MASQKKCSECGQWSNWNHQPADQCEHCGGPLDKRAILELEVYHNQERKNDKNSFFAPKPGDSTFMMIIRRTTWFIHIIYMSIVSFILWFIAWAAG